MCSWYITSISDLVKCLHLGRDGQKKVQYLFWKAEEKVFAKTESAATMNYY